MIKNKLSYNFVLIHFVIAFSSILINSTQNGASYLAVSILLSALYLGVNPLSSAICYGLGFLVGFSLNKTICALISAIVVCPIFALLKKKKIKINGKIIPLSVLAVLPFIIFGDFENKIFLSIEGAVSVILTPVFISAIRVILIKRFKYKINLDELVSLSVFAVALGLGLINLLGFNVYRSACIFIILCSLSIFGGGTTTVTSVILSVAPSVSALSLDYFSAFTVIAVISSAFNKKSKFLVGLTALTTDLLFLTAVKLYGEFYYLDALYSIVPVALYLFLPTELFKHLELKTKSLNEKLLPRYTVNRMRIALSGKLYDVAGVFNEMKQGFEKLKRNSLSGDELLGRMADEVMLNVCESCPSFLRCKQKNMPERDELISIISVGVAKNRISLIDLTKKFAENCGYVNSVIFEINALIGKYREKVKEMEDLSSGKELITMQTDGVSGVLKNLALDFSKTLSFTGETEKIVAEHLRKFGINYVELLALGEEDNLEINVILNPDELDVTKLSNAVSNALNKQMSVTNKTSLSMNACAVTLRPSPMLDAAFGLAVLKKDGSCRSGDTHALTKIDEGTFLIALSDGMGSGTLANQTSSTAVSLIESFYKAGLESQVILKMVNKVLALNTDDNFSAIDVLTVNLFDLHGDFIKIGSPASYLISQESIRIIEGNSLPLGILDDLKPTGISLPIEEGCTVLMVTDGISDAFGSSTDLISYLKTLKSLNPQRLADDLLQKALSLDENKPKDDMTVLAVRIFKKAS